MSRRRKKNPAIGLLPLSLLLGAVGVAGYFVFQKKQNDLRKILATPTSMEF